MPDYAIDIRNLTMIYRTGFWKRRMVAVSDLSLAVERRQVFGYLGANGAGKTTTIKILVGLMHPASGSARIFGEDVSSMSVKRRLGYMPEDPYFYEYLTALESLDFYARLLDVPRATRRRRIDEMLDLVGLARARKTRVRAFSKGMRQRLGLAQAIIADPELVILDEPFSGLDPMGRQQMRNVILSLRDQGRTLFFSSHILADVEMICDQVAILTRGKLTAIGRLDELLTTQVQAVELVAEMDSEEIPAELSALSERLLRQGPSVSFRVKDEAAADQAVEVIRRHGGRLRAMIPQRETLEDYFVRTAQAPDAPGRPADAPGRPADARQDEGTPRNAAEVPPI